MGNPMSQGAITGPGCHWGHKYGDLVLQDGSLMTLSVNKLLLRPQTIKRKEGVSKHQQLKKKSAATAVNTVLTSAQARRKLSAYHISSVIVTFVIIFKA
jgi:hypothetical protein